jgi:hypothetical protein
MSRSAGDRQAHHPSPAQSLHAARLEALNTIIRTHEGRLALDGDTSRYLSREYGWPRAVVDRLVEALVTQGRVAVERHGSVIYLAAKEGGGQ